MPPATRAKKGAAGIAAAGAPPLPPAALAGCCVAFSGNFGSGHTQASLLEDAASLGAQTAKSVSKDVTHLVTTQADCDKPSTKVLQAQDRGLFIVSLAWILQADEFGFKQPEADFALTARDDQATSAVDPATDVSKKRQASDSPAPETKKPKLDPNAKIPALGHQQKAKDWAVQVPLDEECYLVGYGVHVDDDRVIWDASLNQTNAGKNNNKFYRIQLLVGPGKPCQTWTRWGRVGERGQNAVLGDGSLADAKKMFGKKFKDKTGLAWEDRAETPKPKKYVYLERNYDPDSDGDDDKAERKGTDGAEERKPPPCTLDPPVQELMKLVFNEKFFAATMSDMRYDDKKLPLGKLSKATIMRGFQALKNLAAIIETPTNAVGGQSVEDLSNLYYSYIPHAFGRDRPPIISNLPMIKREIDLLETLADLKDATNIMQGQIDEMNRLHPLDRQFQGLKLREMTPLDPRENEFKMLERYLMNTRGSTHHNVNYQVEDIFRIERQGEKDRFSQSVFAGPPKDRRLLWHGSRATNFGGILSQGLRIAPPEAPVSGYMFGKGVYLADMSSKSANYCCHFISDNTALLLLCEAELGTPMLELTGFDYDAPENAKKKGCWSTFGRGGTGPSQWKDAACIHPSLKGVMVPSTERAPPGPTGINSQLLYNEYICYDVSQIRLRYLFRVKM